MLNVSGLISGLTSVFAEMPGDAGMAAKKISIEYDKYCKAGMAPPGLPVFTGTEAFRMEHILSGVLSMPGGNPASVGAAFVAGIQAYWLTPPVPFVAGVVAGMTTAMPGAGAVAGIVSGALANPGNTASTIAGIIGGALDMATRTLLITYVMPVPPAGPPPPAMLI